MVYSIDSYDSLGYFEDIIKEIARSHEIGEEPVFITVIGNNCHLRNSSNKNNNDNDNDIDKFVKREDVLKFINRIPGKMCQYRGIGAYFDDPISKQQIDAYVSVSFWEVSDKTGLNVEKAFINSYIMQQIFKQFSKKLNAFKITNRNKLLLICFGFNRCKKRSKTMIPTDVIVIVHEYLDGLFWNDSQSSSNQCCCSIV